MKPMIQMLDGTGFDFTNIAVPSIQTIAGALAKLCRFVGHTRDFYSVAQHSVYVSHLVLPQYALAALLHDASEALTGDCSSPLKQMLPEFRDIERRVQDLIYRTYCPDIRWDKEQQDAVRAADLQMLAAERRDLMPKQDPDDVWGWVNETIIPAPVLVTPMAWRVAEVMFLRRFYELRGQA